MRSSQMLTDMYSFSHSKHLSPLIDRNVCVCLFSEGGQRNKASLYETSHAAVTLTVFNGESIRDDGYCGCELKCSVLAKWIARAPI